MYVVTFVCIQLRLEMPLYTSTAFLRITIDLVATIYNAFLRERLQHPPYNDFYKAVFFYM